MTLPHDLRLCISSLALVGPNQRVRRDGFTPPELFSHRTGGAMLALGPSPLLQRYSSPVFPKVHACVSLHPSAYSYNTVSHAC